MGFFDMPAGYSDADLEMASLEARGNQYRRLVRKAGSAENVERLRAGETVHVKRYVNGDVHEGVYVALMRMTDPELDAGLEYSVDGGASWYGTAKAARLAEAVA